MSERPPVTESFQEDNPKKRIAFVDTKNLVDSESRDLAERRMLEDRESSRGVGGILKKIWKHDLFREYYRQKEIYKAKAELMEGGGNLYSEEGEEKHQHAATMQAITERFISDYEETLHQGEERGVLGSSEESKEVEEKIKGLIRMYAQGAVDEKTFSERRLQILTGLHELNPDLVSPEYVQADNLLEIAKNAKESVDHGASLDELDLDFEIILGRARSGIRTESEKTTVDSIVEKLSKTKISMLLHESTIAAAVAGFYSAGVFASKRLTGSKLFAWGTFGATAVLGGAVAATRENKRFKEERVHHIREMAKGRDFRPEDDSGREEIDVTRYETRDAQELILNLEAVLYGGEGEISEMTEEKFNSAISMLAEIDSRVNVSDSRNVDLISFSAPHLAEQERLKLDILRAQAKVDLRKFSKSEDSFFDEGFDFDKHLEDTVRTKEFDLENGAGGVNSKDRVFNKMKKGKVARAFVKGVITGVVIGGAIQEAAAIASDDIMGITEGHIKSRTGGDINTTPLETLRKLFSGELKVSGAGSVPYSVGGNEIVVPPGMDVVPLRDGRVNLQFGDRLVASDVSFNPDGTLSEEVKEAIESRGITVIEQRIVSGSGDVVTKVLLENPDTVTNIAPPVALPLVLRKTLSPFREKEISVLGAETTASEEEKNTGTSPESVTEGETKSITERPETIIDEVEHKENKIEDSKLLASLGLEKGATLEDVERAMSEILSEHKLFVQRMHPVTGSQKRRATWKGYEDDMETTYEAIRAYGKLNGVSEGETEDNISRLRDADILGLNVDSTVSEAKKAHSEIRSFFLKELEKIKDRYSKERIPIDRKLLEAYEAFMRIADRGKPKTGIEKLKDWDARNIEISEDVLGSEKEIQLDQASSFLSQLEEMSQEASRISSRTYNFMIGRRMEDIVEKIGLLAWSLEKKGLDKKEAQKIEDRAREVFEKTSREIFASVVNGLEEDSSKMIGEVRVISDDIINIDNKSFRTDYAYGKKRVLEMKIEEIAGLNKIVRETQGQISAFVYKKHSDIAKEGTGDSEWINSMKESLTKSRDNIVVSEQILAGASEYLSQKDKSGNQTGEQKNDKVSEKETTQSETEKSKLEDLAEQVSNLKQVILGTKESEVILPEIEVYVRNMELSIKQAKRENDPDEGDNRKVVRGMERDWRIAASRFYRISSKSLLEEINETEKSLDSIEEELEKGELTLKEINEKFSYLGGGNIQALVASLQERSVHAADGMDEINQEMMRISPENVRYWPKSSARDRNAIRKNIDKAKNNTGFISRKSQNVLDLIKEFKFKGPATEVKEEKEEAPESGDVRPTEFPRVSETGHQNLTEGESEDYKLLNSRRRSKPQTLRKNLDKVLESVSDQEREKVLAAYDRILIANGFMKEQPKEGAEPKPDVQEEGIETVTFQEAIDEINAYTDDLLDLAEETTKENFLEKNKEMQEILKSVRELSAEISQSLDQRKAEAVSLAKTDPDKATEMLRLVSLERAQMESRLQDAESILEAVTENIEI